MTSTITKSPTAFVQRLKAGSGNGDQITLIRQYKRYTSSGLLTLSRAVVLSFRRNKTAIPANISPAKIPASMGLPSRVDARPPEPPPPIPHQSEAGLDPAIQIQITGNQRALELRVDLS